MAKQGQLFSLISKLKARLDVPSKGAGLRGNTLLQATISEEDVGVVVDQVEVVLVEDTSQVGLGDSETDGVGDTLSKGTGGDLDSVSDVNLRMTGGSGTELSESLQVIEGEVVSGEVEHDVLEGTGVSVRENESISVDPLGVLGVGLEEPKKRASV